MNLVANCSDVLQIIQFSFDTCSISHAIALLDDKMPHLRKQNAKANLHLLV